ncbi:hypothetical protein E1B28_000340 [Marasmius oreades]|uniref:EGF-like domain-containing protein n=1 Tax=Marasmius oreades TaxID=181124 RepID=A0A9P8AE88_9AGAR|nr:uncharacterized protein E1B28_000340 [Marasmius oreades]KAG7098382.1 hypothetical protein E1B28_000340 [Marasmius oreades]
MFSFILVPVLLLVLTHLIQACASDDDCSLNGLCVQNTCICDPGWTSSDCGKLDLYPATRYTGYNWTHVNLPSYYGTKGNSSWGGQIIQDRTDRTLFHLILEHFSWGCGLSAWRPFSVIARAESRTGPAGPYHYAQELYGAFRHNPSTVWSEADNAYLMYTIGIETELPTTCRSFKWANNISVATAPDIRGPWNKFTPIMNGTNPSAWPLWTSESPTSDIALAVEDNVIFQAPDFEGIYDKIKIQTWNTSDNSPTWTEDPFLWRDKRGNWHILAHWMIDIAERGEKYPRVGAHLYSRDLSGNWTFKLQEAYNTTVVFTDGGRTDYMRRERPKLFFSDDGEMTLLYFSSGVQEFNSSATYTVIQPLGQRAKEYEEALRF